MRRSVRIATQCLPVIAPGRRVMAYYNTPPTNEVPPVTPTIVVNIPEEVVDAHPVHTLRVFALTFIQSIITFVRSLVS